jgi:hypothetical protein
MSPLLLLGFAFLPAALAISAASGPATLTPRDFPADEDPNVWEDSERFQQWVVDLIIQSGGVGIGIGLILTIVMFFHMCCFGFCCNFCRCGPCSMDSTRKSGAHRSKMCRNVCLLVSFLIFGIAACGTGLVFTQTTTLYENVDSVFTHVVDAVVGAESLACSGPIVDRFKAGETVAQVVSAEGSNYNVLSQCGQSSVGQFLYRIDGQINTTLGATIGAIDGFVPISTSFATTVDTMTTSIGHLNDIETTITTIASDTSTVKGNLDNLHGTGSFPAIPTSSDIPELDSTEVGRVSVTKTALTTARDNTISPRDSIATTVSDLQTNTRPDVVTSWDDVYSSISDFETQILDNTKILATNQGLVEDWKTLVGDTEQMGEPVFAVAFGLTVAFLLLMIIGQICKKTSFACCGAYGIFFLFIWISLLLGIGNDHHRYYYYHHPHHHNFLRPPTTHKHTTTITITATT